ncbi:PLP-dependent aminotransferase family protein, partial [Lactobacillus delbrueckii subsp. lactis]|nr:PLP-dependent aminotransferase family protein [Lactobacillus delbrueckii subsp. lactis]
DYEMAVEAPSYVGALAAFDNYEPVYHEIPLEDDGVNLDYFEEVLKEHPAIKLFYTVPDFHNPTGITMSLTKRQRLVDLANRYNFVILEDTPYRDLCYHGESLPSIKSFDTEGRVIFLSTFSKILSPAFRLGWLVAGLEIKEQLVNLK